MCLGILVLVLTLWLGIGFMQSQDYADSDYLVKTSTKSGYHGDRLIIEVKDAKTAKEVAGLYGMEIEKQFKHLSKKHNAWVGVLGKNTRALETGKAIEAIVAELRAHAGVVRANYDYMAYLTVIPNDPKFGELWGLHNNNDTDIDAPEAWNISTGSANVVVAMFDTGIDYNHSNLAANMWKNPGEIANNNVDDDNNGYIDDIYGIDVAYRDTNPMDDHYHGTHTAGTVGARGNDGFGVVGVNWDVKLMALKLFDSSGSCYTSRAIECYEYVIDQKQKGQNIVAVNNSWGGTDAIQELFDVIKLAGENGILSVCAAGNSSKDNDAIPFYPSGYDTPYVIAVAATNSDNTLADYSHWGATTVDLGAPGSGITSCAPGNTWKLLSGTSMATPHVSGAVALLASIFPNDTALQRKKRIMDNVDPHSSLNGKCVTGGRLNLYKAATSGCMANADFSVAKNGDLGRIFTDKSTGSGCELTDWSWNFGDGGTSIQQNPTHTYAAAGYYDVTLTVGGGTNTTSTLTKKIWAGPNKAPVANFSYSPGTAFELKFKDLSTDADGDLVGWSWNFGDGTTATLKNPIHTYMYPGTYNVTLTVTDGDGSTNPVTKAVDVNVTYCESSSNSGALMYINKVQVGSFNNPSTGKATYTDYTALSIALQTSQAYTLTVGCSTSSSSSYVRVWIDYNLDGDFDENGEKVLEKSGYGTISGTLNVPVSGVVTGKKLRMRVSANQSTYRDVCATATGWGEVEDYVVIINGGSSNQAPTANFSTSTSGLTVTCTNSSTDSDGTIASYAWTFGDATTSTLQNPVHTYAVAGTYTIGLTVTDNGGLTGTVSKQVTVSAANQAPTANFSTSASGLTVTCANSSTDSDGTISSYAWTFGDATTSTLQNPVHTYAAAGTYTIALTVTDNGGLTGTVSKQVTVSSGGSELPTYCTSASSTSYFGHIAGVAVGGFSNTSGASKYTSYTTQTVNLTHGQSYNVALTSANASGWYGNWRIYIDYNRDGDFDDAGEIAYQGYYNGTGTLNGSFTVPASVTLNSKLGMRVSVKYSTSSGSYRGACETASWGEVEDYAVVIL